MRIKGSRGDNLLAVFNEAASFQKLPRFEKIKQKPIRTLFKYALETIGRLLNFRFPVIAKTFFGDRMKVILPETVSAAIYRYGVHEADLTEYLLKTLGGGRYVYRRRSALWILFAACGETWCGGSFIRTIS